MNLKLRLIIIAMSMLNLGYGQEVKHLQLGIYTGHVVNFWDELEDYKRENEGFNPSYGIKICYAWKNTAIGLQLGLEKQHFANIRTGPIFNNGTIIKRDIVLKFYNPEISILSNIWSSNRHKLMSEVGAALKINYNLAYTTISNDGRIIFRTESIPEKKTKFTMNTSIIYQYSMGRFNFCIKGGLNNCIVNLYSDFEESRNVVNYNTRVSFVSQAMLFYNIW